MNNLIIVEKKYIKKLDDEGFQYEDEKYVRAAGNYLWLGILMALDGVFHVRQRSL